LTDVKQDNLFSSPDDAVELERQYITYLESRGYEVIKLKKGTRSVTIAEVVEYFYKNLKTFCGEKVVLAARLSDKKDFKAVSRFQEKAKKVGLSKSAANETLIDLISLVFSYYRDTKKECPLSDLSYLISQRGSWMVQMSIQHRRKEDSKWERSEQAEIIKRQIYSDLDNDVFQKLKESKHSKILNKQETKDGKKN